MEKKELSKTNISEIEKKDWWKLKKWDIAMVTKKDWWNWISIIWKVIFINDEKIKIASIKDGRGKTSVEILTYKLDNDEIKLSFGDKNELMSTIFEIKQRNRDSYEYKKSELESTKRNIINFETDLNLITLDGELNEDIITKNKIDKEDNFNS